MPRNGASAQHALISSAVATSTSVGRLAPTALWIAARYISTASALSKPA